MKNGGGNKQAYGRPASHDLGRGNWGGPLEISPSEKTKAISKSPVGLILLSPPYLPGFF